MADHSAVNVAYKFLQFADEELCSLTPMQLQKLVYIAHGWSLGILDRPLIADTVNAWKYGPVIDSVYHHFKNFRAAPVTFSNELVQHYVTDAGFCSTDEDLIRSVWGAYKGMTGPRLSDLTHQPGTPWYTVWNDRDGKSHYGAEIDQPTIIQYYKKFFSQA